MSKTDAARIESEAGAAVITTLMVMLLMAAITAGFTALVITDTRVRTLDGTRTQAFYAVHAGLEKLTSDLGDLFSANVAPTGAEINALTDSPPDDLGATWTQPDGSNGYRITFDADEDGNPAATVETVQQGPFEGLVGLATSYAMTVTGHVGDGSEASLTRTLQTVAIPVFQFGIFSENDLSFFPGPPFNFGGRVHSNSNVFLATESTSPGLTLSDRVTAVGEIIRKTLSNGQSTEDHGYNGYVRVITAPASYRNLGMTEGSLVDGLGSAQNPNWNTLSTGTYNHNIMNGRTGAKRLDLPIAQFGAQPIDLIRRPAVDEDTTRPNVLAERFYALASLRILLSDTAADITSLPGIDTSVAPIPLGTAEPSGYTISSTTPRRPPFAESPGTGTTGVDTPSGTPLLGGYLKIEKQTSPGVWQDVTLEILSLGFNEPQLRSSAPGGSTCSDYTPNAIIRLQRPWDNGGTCYSTSNLFGTSTSVARRYTPLALFDPREALYRDSSPGSSPEFGGVMYLVDLDARNLARWFTGQISSSDCPIACTGTSALNVNGYTVYLSDRRGNRNLSNEETGEYGDEDIVNTGSSGTPNNALDEGEDFNGNGVLDDYGKTPRLPFGMSSWPSSGSLRSSSRPWSTLSATEARRNPAIFFRRALRLVNGQDLYDAAPGLEGLTIASENPVYVLGDWNANVDGDDNFNNDDHVATAVLADAVTLLSRQWNDANSFANPYSPGDRDASTTSYRLAIIAGKGLSFPWSSTPKDFGTDGGAHNFLRYIEDWGGETLYYRGSIASLFYSRQATGTYKCCSTVYAPPSRGYNFDTEFLTPSLLPPRTPMFRDVNITGFQQIIRPE
jgi:hypothetical protein